MRRTTLVTGAASGIGKAASDLLTRNGDRVIGIDLNQTDILADLGTAQGRDEAMRQAAIHAQGSLDGIIVCAGVLGRGADTVSVNYFGAIALLEGLLPLLGQSASPRAVAISSVAAYFPTDQALVDLLLAGDEAPARAAALTLDETAIYAASKRALTQWCRRTAVTAAWAGRGVLLNVVAPGLVETGMSRDTFTSPARRAQVAAMMPAPLGRHAQPDEIAQLIVFLASPANSFTVGQTIFCDGGQEAFQRP